MHFDKLLKFQGKILFFFFHCEKNIRIQFHSFGKGTFFIHKTPFVCFKCSSANSLPNLPSHCLRHCRPFMRYSTVTFYFLERMVGYQPKYCTKVYDFMYIHEQRNKNCYWTNNSQKQYIVRKVKIPLLFIQCNIWWKWNVFIHTCLSNLHVKSKVRVYRKIITNCVTDRRNSSYILQ